MTSPFAEREPNIRGNERLRTSQIEAFEALRTAESTERQLGIVFGGFQ